MIYLNSAQKTLLNSRLTALGLTAATIQAASGTINSSTTLTATPGFILTGSMNGARTLQTQTLLNNGMVLIAGGYDGYALASAELYNPVTGTFAITGSLNTPRFEHTATLDAAVQGEGRRRRKGGERG